MLSSVRKVDRSNSAMNESTVGGPVGFSGQVPGIHITCACNIEISEAELNAAFKLAIKDARDFHFDSMALIVGSGG